MHNHHPPFGSLCLLESPHLCHDPLHSTHFLSKNIACWEKAQRLQQYKTKTPAPPARSNVASSVATSHHTGAIFETISNDTWVAWHNCCYCAWEHNRACCNGNGPQPTTHIPVTPNPSYTESCGANTFARIPCKTKGIQVLLQVLTHGTNTL